MIIPKVVISGEGVKIWLIYGFYLITLGQESNHHITIPIHFKVLDEDDLSLVRTNLMVDTICWNWKGYEASIVLMP